MGGGSRNRERELERQMQEQRRQAEQDRAFYQQQFFNYQPSELEKRTEKGALEWLDFVEGKGAPVDYTKAPGLVHLGMYDEGAANRFAERTATGGLQMGRDGANATAVAMRREQLADQMRERRGQDLVNAVRAKDASIRGEITPYLIGTAEGRQQSKLGSAQSAYGTSQQGLSSARSAYASIPQSTPWWQTALGGAMSMFSFQPFKA